MQRFVGSQYHIFACSISLNRTIILEFGSKYPFAPDCFPFEGKEVICQVLFSSKALSLRFIAAHHIKPIIASKKRIRSIILPKEETKALKESSSVMKIEYEWCDNSVA